MGWIGWVIVAVVGALVTSAATIGARHTVIPAWEHRAFHAVNGLPGWLYVPLWLPMQFGNLVVGAAAGLAVALWEGSVGLAAAVLAATFLKLVAERVIRKEMAGWLTVRQRPGTSQPGAVLRGRDVPACGPSFPSGHVILAFGVACVVMSTLPAAGAVAFFVAAVLVMLGRVYVGAHNPLDVTAGAGAGLLVGGGLAAVLAL